VAFLSSVSDISPGLPSILLVSSANPLASASSP